MQKTLTFEIGVLEEKKILEYCKTLGELKENSNSYVKWALKGVGWTAMMYTSGKLVLQVNDVSFEEEFVQKFFKKEAFQPHIGCDEVGKGDYFGPLVVCACYVKGDEDLDVMDSKKLTDEKILKIGKELSKKLQYELKIVFPKEYDEIIKKTGNLSILLARAHAQAVKKLLGRVKEEVFFVVVDQFSKSKKRLENEFDIDIPLRQYHRAESDIAVAAASILARYFFLLEFEKMNKKYSTKFPLGATHVIPFAKSFVEKYGSDELKDVAKVSFRTTKKIIS